MSDDKETTYTYDPSVFFTPRTVERAKAVILTGEDSSPEERWERETPYFTDLILENVSLGPISRLMDYGCGVGRLSRELLLRTQCRTFGVDLSPTMQALAIGYVYNPLFLACSPQMMVDLPQMDVIISVFVLQHIPDPETTLLSLMSKLRPSGKLFIANSHTQCFPIEKARWLRPRKEDEVDVLGLCREHLKEVVFHDGFDPEHCTPKIAKHGWWGVYER